MKKRLDSNTKLDCKNCFTQLLKKKKIRMKQTKLKNSNLENLNFTINELRYTLK